VIGGKLSRAFHSGPARTMEASGVQPRHPVASKACNARLVCGPKSPSIALVVKPRSRRSVWSCFTTGPRQPSFRSTLHPGSTVVGGTVVPSGVADGTGPVTFVVGDRVAELRTTDVVPVPDVGGTLVPGGVTDVPSTVAFVVGG
jgi:hypothetical protein